MRAVAVEAERHNGVVVGFVVAVRGVGVAAAQVAGVGDLGFQVVGAGPSQDPVAGEPVVVWRVPVERQAIVGYGTGGKVCWRVLMFYDSVTC